MSEQPPMTVDQAFDPEQRQAQKDFDAYLESRPYQDEKGNVHDPADGKFMNGDQHFDDRRKAGEAEGQTMYEDMSPSQLTRKLAEAGFHGDRTSATNIDEVLQNKLNDLDDKYFSERDDSSTSSTREHPDNGMNHNDLRHKKLRDRITTIHDRELERLKKENPQVAAKEAEKPDKAEAKAKSDYVPDYESDYIPDWVPGNPDKARQARQARKAAKKAPGDREETAESLADTQKMDEVSADDSNIDETLLFEPGGIGKRVRGAMAGAARKLRDLPTRGFVAGQAKMANAQEFYNDDERGQRRRKITAAVVGAVGLAGLSYLANKGADVSGGVSHSAGEVSQTHPHALGLEVAPVSPGAKAHQHAQEAVSALGGTAGGTGSAGKHAVASEMTLRHGHTIWDDEQHMIAQKHPNFSHVELEEHTQKAVNETLQANGLSYEDARHLPDNFQYRIPPHLQAELLGDETS